MRKKLKEYGEFMKSFIYDIARNMLINKNPFVELELQKKEGKTYKTNYQD